MAPVWPRKHEHADIVIEEPSSDPETIPHETVAVHEPIAPVETVSPVEVTAHEAIPVSPVETVALDKAIAVSVYFSSIEVLPAIAALSAQRSTITAVATQFAAISAAEFPALATSADAIATTAFAHAAAAAFAHAAALN